MSEAEILAHEAAAARSAMDGTLREMLGAPPGKLGWKVWAGKHPYVLISGAAATGAVASRFFLPRRRNGHWPPTPNGDGLAGTVKDLGKDFLRIFVEGLLVTKAATSSHPETEPPRTTP